MKYAVLVRYIRCFFARPYTEEFYLSHLQTVTHYD